MESLSLRLVSWFLTSLWTDIFCCNSNTTTHCISAQQTLHCNCACTKTKGAGDFWSTLAWGHGAEHFHGPSPPGCKHLCISALVSGQQRWQPMTLSYVCRTPDFIIQLLTNYFKYSSKLSYSPWEAVIFSSLERSKTSGGCPGGPGQAAVGDPVQLEGLKRSLPNSPTLQKSSPCRQPALTMCRYSRGAIRAVPPLGTDFFHPALKAD